MDDTIVHASSYWGHLFGYTDKQKPDKRCSRLGTRAATQESGFGDHDGTAGPGAASHQKGVVFNPEKTSAIES